MTNNYTHFSQSFGSALGIGFDPAGGRIFNGWLDDVRVYRRAFSGTQIAQLASEWARPTAPRRPQAAR